MYIVGKKQWFALDRDSLMYLFLWGTYSVSVHVLIDCVVVCDIRQTFNNGKTKFDLFTNVAGDTMLAFLKESNWYTKI
jgi:hypothetical protein